MKTRLLLLMPLALALGGLLARGDTPPARSVSSETLDGAGNAVSSTVVGPARGLDVNVLGTLTLPTGGATAARQDTGNTSLGSIDTKLSSQATAANQSTGNGSLSSIDGKLAALVSGRVPVDGSAVTQPVSASSLPLPTGASTSANQSTGNSSLSSIDGKLAALISGRMPVDGSGVTQPVSASALPLPSGAATAAKQPALGTAGTAATDVISVQGIASMTALKVDGSAVTQPISASALPLPSGASTAANQTTGNGSLSSIDGKLAALISGRMPVDGSGVTQPISAAALPLPTGAATSASQTTGNGSLSSIDGKLAALVSGRMPVDGSGVTQPVSASALPLPSGAATAAKQPALGTAGSASADVISVQGVASMTALKVDGSAVTQPVSASALPLPSGASTAAKQPALGTAGTASSDVVTVQGIASMTALKVDGSGVTQPISAAALPLPSGAATAASQTTGNSSLSSIDGKLAALVSGRMPVDGSGVTQPISAAALPLPSGAATVAKQPALGTAGTASTDVISVQGIASMTALKVDGSAVTQPISASALPLPSGAATSANQSTMITALQLIDNIPHSNDTALSNGVPMMGQLDDVSTGTVTENNVSTVRITAARAHHVNLRDNSGNELGISSAPLRTDPTGTTTQPVGGNAAHGASDSGNPVKIGGRYTTSPGTLTNNQRGDAMLDKFSNLRANTGGTSFVSYTSAQTATVIKSGAGRLINVCLTTKGANTDTLQLWDNTAASGSVIWTTTLGGTAVPLTCARVDVDFSTGLTITTVGGTSNWSIIYE